MKLPQIPVCPNCKSEWRKGDRYCRFCGAPMDKPVLVPDEIQDVYGPPPVRRTHKNAKKGDRLKLLFNANNPELESKPVCPNCKNDWHKGDRYCRFCGAPIKKPVLIPYEIEILYGPMPIERTHKCSSCGYTWTTEKMIDDENYCPKCGKAGTVQEEPEDRRW